MVSLAETFRTNLVELRKKRSITQQELADILNKHRPFVADLERGRNVPTLHTIEAIARAFDVNPVSLLQIKK